MPDKQTVTDRIIAQGVLPLFYHKSEDVSINITRTLYKAGIRVIEYTNCGEAALKSFKALKKLQAAEFPDMLLGMGTVKSAEHANDFVAAGADFLIAPIVNPEVANIALKNGLIWIPGCMTPTEIYNAQLLGASIIKIFPANILGPGFISSVKELFAGQMFMPTGGVEIEQGNISAWFDAGVRAVGMGSKLITADIMENGQYDKLYADTVTVLNMVKAAR